VTKPSLPLADLSETGLLWLINRVVFHPRGFALALVKNLDGQILGWSLEGDGSEPWCFEGDEDQHFRAAEATFAAARVKVAEA
jgi:hypothetical protein